MKELEQIRSILLMEMRLKINNTTDSQDYEISSVLAKAIEQYVIKARIRELEKLLSCSDCSRFILKRIAEYKKGLDK